MSTLPFRHAVALGGGHGLSRTLRALPEVARHVTAVITAADDGGSSGRLRRDLGVLPPGDLRMALAALCPDPALVELLQHRFRDGELGGHSLGNLVLVALAELEGDVVAGLDRAGRLLGARGRVLPCSPQPLTLKADAAGGSVEGQAQVQQCTDLREIALIPPDPPATPEAVAAVADADLLVLGPGSLFTSLLPNLLVPALGEAVVAATATTVLVANLREQPGETEGLTLGDHLAALREHRPGLRPDVVLVHDGRAPAGAGAPLRIDGADDPPRIVRADLLDGHDGHDPVALARALAALA